MTNLETKLAEIKVRAEALKKPGAAWHMEVKAAQSQADVEPLLRLVEVLIKQRNHFADCWKPLVPFDEAIEPFDQAALEAMEGKP
jgi:hypothetical protein